MTLALSQLKALLVDIKFNMCKIKPIKITTKSLICHQTDQASLIKQSRDNQAAKCEETTAFHQISLEETTITPTTTVDRAQAVT